MKYYCKHCNTVYLEENVNFKRHNTPYCKKCDKRITNFVPFILQKERMTNEILVQR